MGHMLRLQLILSSCQVFTMHKRISDLMKTMIMYIASLLIPLVVCNASVWMKTDDCNSHIEVELQCKFIVVC